MIVIEKSKLHILLRTERGKEEDTSARWDSDKHLQGVSIVHVLPFAQLAEVWIERYEGILRSKVQGVVDAPVHLRRKHVNQEFLFKEFRATHTSRTFLAGWNNP